MQGHSERSSSQLFDCLLGNLLTGNGWSRYARISGQDVTHGLLSGVGSGCTAVERIQGYLAHKKQPPPQDPTVGLCLGPYGGLREVAISYKRGTPVFRVGGWYLQGVVADGGLDASRKVDIGLLGEGNPSSHGTRPVHQNIWIRTSRLSMKNALYLQGVTADGGLNAPRHLLHRATLKASTPKRVVVGVFRCTGVPGS